MEYVTEDLFVKLLNEELMKDPEGAYLKPFVLGSKGFNWPHESFEKDKIYRRVANRLRERYGIYH